MRETKNVLADFQHIQEVIGLLNCQLCEDRGGDDASQPLYYLGEICSPADGIAGYDASPTFPALAALDQFCAEHLTQYDAVAMEIARTGEIPDVWFWTPEDSGVNVLSSGGQIRRRAGMSPF